MIKSHPSNFHYWPYIFGLFSIQSLIAIISIITSPSDPENRVFLGLSIVRFVFLLALIGFACFTGFVSVY